MTEERGVVKYQARDGQEISLSFETVRRYLIQGKSELVTPQEMIYFMGVCKSRGLNPFKKDAYLIKYSNDPAAIVTSIDYFRSRAKAQPDCQGWKKGLIVQGKLGSIHDSAGILLEGEKLIGGFFEAKPIGWDEIVRLEVNLAGYIKKTKEGQITKFWQADNQPTMISKVAESQGLRQLWPDEFQGLYEEAEIRQIDRIETAIPSAMDLTEKILHGGKENAAPDSLAELRAEFINLRSTGPNQFSKWVNENLERFSSFPSGIKAEILAKWNKLYSEPFPWEVKAEEKGVPDTLREVQNEVIEDDPIPTPPWEENGQPEPGLEAEKGETVAFGFVPCPKKGGVSEKTTVCEKCLDAGRCNNYKDWVKDTQ